MQLINSFFELYPTKRSRGATIPEPVKLFIGIQILVLAIAGAVIIAGAAIDPAVSSRFGQYLVIVFALSMTYQSVAYRADSDYLVKDTSEIIILSSIVLFHNLFFTVVTVIFYMLSHFIFGMRGPWQFLFNTCNSLIAALISFYMYAFLQTLIPAGTTADIVLLALILYVIHYLAATIPVVFVVASTMRRPVSHVASNLFDLLDEVFHLALGVTTLVFFILLPEFYYLLFLLLFLLFSQQIQRQKEIKSKKVAEEKLTQIEHERELDSLRYQKLDALQSLAGKVAHDINNYLTIISGNLDIVRMDHPEQSAELDHIETGVENTRNIIHELLEFAATDRLNVKPVELNQFVRGVLEFTLSGSKIESRFVAADEDIMVELDEGKLTQAISNIAINATQATDQSGRIETRIDTSDDKTVAIHISDNGRGIPEGNRERIFEPYFTTKSEGNGLGMASAHAIVTAHGGTLTFDSIEGEGTTFTISLPLPEEESSGPR